MRKLISLKHLYIGGSYSLKHLPKGIGRLTSLQTLDVCPLFSVDNDEAFQVGDLRTLNHLQGNLTIRILGKLKDGSQVGEAQLRDNKQLFHLQLDFAELCEVGESIVRIMNVLRPHDNLESLGIDGNFGSTWPNWMFSLKKLRFLTLQDNSGCESLPPLVRLPFLEKLYVGEMSGVRKVGGEFLGLEDDQTSSSFKSSSSILFPKLKQLHFYKMSSWKRWEGVKGWNKGDSGITIMPCLSSLEISQCYALETLPDFLCKIPLQNLTIFWCPKLEERCKHEERQ
ncbi:putative disease resistance RPP13-like protein 1 [Pyrus x bretschneideri]|uniref:putative disease resistance RPP13-like protein 1 n=1 Tax=Pyrus x bretschneideri TaxID=225117 RepID=UPI00202F17DB|nr:putative disease resistance RPP13-like protein 1 [Pyrus x bretschneideri]